MSRSIVGIVLAGGRSSRMEGRDKAFVPLRGRPLVEHAIETLTPQVDAVAVNANAGAERFARYGLPILPDTIPGYQGPLAGILAGLEWAAQRGANRLVTLPVDTPFAPGDLVARLTEAQGERPGSIVLAASAGRLHPGVGLWPASLGSTLASHLAGGGSRKVRAFADTHGGIAATFLARMIGAVAVDPFMNVNTPADLDDADKIAEGLSP